MRLRLRGRVVLSVHHAGERVGQQLVDILPGHSARCGAHRMVLFEQVSEDLLRCELLSTLGDFRNVRVTDGDGGVNSEHLLHASEEFAGTLAGRHRHDRGLRMTGANPLDDLGVGCDDQPWMIALDHSQCFVCIRGKQRDNRLSGESVPDAVRNGRLMRDNENVFRHVRARVRGMGWTSLWHNRQ